LLLSILLLTATITTVAAAATATATITAAGTADIGEDIVIDVMKWHPSMLLRSVIILVYILIVVLRFAVNSSIGIVNITANW
jgi:hypothetical protein